MVPITDAVVVKNSDGTYSVQVSHGNGAITDVNFPNMHFSKFMADAYAATLKGVGKIEAFVATATKDLEEAGTASEEDADSILESAKADAEKFLAAAKVEAEKLKTEALKLKSEAEAAVVSAIDRAEAEAKKILAAAKAEAEKLITECHDAIASLKPVVTTTPAPAATPAPVVTPAKAEEEEI